MVRVKGTLWPFAGTVSPGPQGDAVSSFSSSHLRGKEGEAGISKGNREEGEFGGQNPAAVPPMPVTPGSWSAEP